MDSRTLKLRREALAELTAEDLRSAVGAEVWSGAAITCLANTCETVRSRVYTLCICQTD